MLTSTAALVLACCLSLYSRPASAHYHVDTDRTYSTSDLVAQLERGHYMDVDGVPAGFECGWRTAAMAHAKELQPFLTAAQQKVPFARGESAHIK